MESRVKTPPPSFYGLETKEEVARHLMNIDFEYNPMKTAIAVGLDVSYNEVENLSGYVPGAMDSTPQGAVTGIVLLSQNLMSNEKAETKEASVERVKFYMVPITRKIRAHPTTFHEGLFIGVAGSKKDPCIFIFKDGYEITADGIPTYGKGLRRVSFAITTMGGEQLLAWQQECLNKH